MQFSLRLLRTVIEEGCESNELSKLNEVLTVHLSDLLVKI